MAVLLAGGAKNDGPAWYRVEVPARWLRVHGADVKTGYGQIDGPMLDGVKVFSTQRGWHPTLLIAVLKMQAMGIRCVYEIDDDIWSVPTYNPLREWFTAEHVRGMEAVMRACDGLTVSTERLATMCAQRGAKNIRVVPNAIPLDLFPAAAPRTKPGVRVGWFGSETHSTDLEQAQPGLRRIMRERKDVTLVFMGAHPKAFPPSDRVEFYDWVDPTEYYAALRALELDVLVAPLVEHRFNYAKSNVKVLEGAALGVAIVASDVGPYTCIRNGETGLTVKANRPDLWASLLMEVTGSELLRMRLGAGARAWVEAECSMEQTGPLWADALGV